MASNLLAAIRSLVWTLLLIYLYEICHGNSIAINAAGVLQMEQILFFFNA